MAVGKNDMDVVKWALAHAVSTSSRIFFIHVSAPFTLSSVPSSPSGISFPDIRDGSISHVREADELLDAKNIVLYELSTFHKSVPLGHCVLRSVQDFTVAFV